MNICVIKAKDTTGTGTTARDITLKKAFEEKGHVINVIYPDSKAILEYEREKSSMLARIMRKLHIKKSESKWDFYSKELEKKIRKDKYDVLIGREVFSSYVLCKNFDAIKIFDVGNIAYIEQYYSGKYYMEVEETYAKELEIFKNVDYILIHDQLLIDYLKKLGFPYLEKIVLAKLGSIPSNKKARYALAPKIVAVGLQNFFPHDYYFLSFLTKISKYTIDCYGLRNSSASFFPVALNYKGYRENMDFLAEYQFGIITVSRDWLREHSPSNKFGDYFSYGLPVLFPKWMRAGYQYKGAIPYDEDNLNDIIAEYSEEGVWRKIHEEALAQADAMNYNKVWKPALDLVENTIRLRRAST